MLNLRTRLVFDAIKSGHQRKSTTKKILSTIFAIFVAIIASTILVGIMGQNMGDFLHRLFTRWYGSYEIYLAKVAVIGTAALSFIFAFKAGLFNIGISGQMLGSGMIMLLVVKNMHDAQVVMPNVLGQFFTLLIAMIAGGLFALFIGILKVFLKINEVVSSILLNWIIFFITRYVVFKADGRKYNPTPNQIGSASIPFEPNYSLNGIAPGYGYIFALIIFISLALLVFIILKYTVFGHKVLSVGRSFEAARYAGYKTRTISLATFVISGALAGALAMVNYTAANNNISISESVDVLPNQGFDGIAIGLISLTHPLATIPIAFLMGALQQSADNLGGSFQGELSGIIFSFIMLGAAMFILFERISPVYWFYKWVYNKKMVEHYKNYENKFNHLISETNAQLSELNKTKHLKNKELNAIYSVLLKNKNDALYQQTLDNYNSAKKSINTWYKNEVIKLQKTYNDAVIQNYAQLKKHLIVEKTNNLYYPEIKVKSSVSSSIKQKEYRISKKISALNDKVFADQLVLKQLINKKIADYTSKASFKYDFFNMFKNEMINSNNQLNDTSISYLQQAFNNDFNDVYQQYQINNDDSIIFNFVESKVNHEIEDLLQLIKVQPTSNDFSDAKNRIDEIMSSNNTYKSTLLRINKNKQKINQLRDDINKLSINVDENIQKKIKLKPITKITRHYEVSKKQIQSLKLDNDQKELLVNWLDLSYAKYSSNLALQQQNQSKDEVVLDDLASSQINNDSDSINKEDN